MGAPTIQATGIEVRDITSDACSISCVAGDGSFRTFWVGEGSSGDLSKELADGTTYVANDVWNTGDIANGFSCVYNGFDTAVPITGLSASTGNAFRVVVCEHNGGAGSEEYLSSTAVGNPFNFTTVQPILLQRRRRRGVRRVPEGG